MATADPPLIYEPLSDHDGVFDKTFRFLLEVAHGIDFYIQEKHGSIYRQSSDVIAVRELLRNRTIKSVDIRPLCSSIIDCYTQLLPYTHDLRERAQVFDIFSGIEFEHHPFHWHKSILIGLETQLRYYLHETYELCKTFLDKTTDDKELIIFIAKHITSFIQQLQNITKTIRRLITVPQNGFYSKIHASNIALAFRKGTSGRRRAINEMVKNKCVPSREALVEVINLRENKENMFVEEEWNTKRGRRKGHGLVNYPFQEHDRKWFLGRIIFALIPVPYSMREISSEGPGENMKADVGMLLGAPPKMIDFTDYIYRDDEENSGIRHYFSPLQFPTPVALNKGGTSLLALWKYITHASEKAGSPVILTKTVGQGAKKKWLFSCKDRKKCKCNYHFWVQWDIYGYYIHHIGCPYHNHERFIANQYERFKCIYCEMTSYNVTFGEHEKICKANYMTLLRESEAKELKEAS